MALLLRCGEVGEIFGSYIYTNNAEGAKESGSGEEITRWVHFFWGLFAYEGVIVQHGVSIRWRWV